VRGLLPGGALVDVEQCCGLAQVDVVDADLGCPISREALLVPAGPRFRIVINSAQPSSGAMSDAVRRQRRRFRIAHELAHTFFYRQTSSGLRRRFPSGDLAEEQFCDDFARWLLIPAQESTITAADVLALHAQYDVSLEVAVRSIACSDMAPRVALWWWRQSCGGSPALLEQWMSDEALPQDLAIVPYRTDPSTLSQRFADATQRFGDALSAAVFPQRRQAVAILSAD
jgi:hypothetical protein